MYYETNKIGGSGYNSPRSFIIEKKNTLMGLLKECIAINIALIDYLHNSFLGKFLFADTGGEGFDLLNLVFWV